MSKEMDLTSLLLQLGSITRKSNEETTPKIIPAIMEWQFPTVI